MIDLRSEKDLTRFLQVLANAAIDMREAGSTDEEAQEAVLKNDPIFWKQNDEDKGRIRRYLGMAVKQLDSTTRRIRVKHEPSKTIACGVIHPKGPTAFGGDVRRSNKLLAEQDARDLEI